MNVFPYAAIALAALTLTGCAGTPSQLGKNFDTAAYYAQDFTCQPDTAKPLALADLERNTEALAGHCVRVTAYARGNILYRDAAEAAAGAQTDDRRIGLDWADQATARRLRLGPSFVTVTGRVRLCSRRRAVAARAAAKQPETGCRGAFAALTVSKAEIVPTAMD